MWLFCFNKKFLISRMPAQPSASCFLSAHKAEKSHKLCMNFGYKIEKFSPLKITERVQGEGLGAYPPPPPPNLGNLVH